ncbi:uncharacterized protein LOC119159443 [Rhipicephalus microplus]|uniref:uncharacterized protein LOC119159443 n=1 Tax=Rhipicephalus microplus TaxID=6941 RepID=UPI003F6CB263
MKARIEDGIVYSPYPYIPLAKDGTLYGFLMEALTAHGSKTALICGQDKVTYINLRDKLRCCASGFRRQGIGKGDRVYVHFGNSIENFVALCSIPLTGASLVTSDIMWREDDIGDKIERSGATHVLTDASHAEMFARIITSSNIKKAFLVGEKRPGFNSVSEIIENEELLPHESEFETGGCTFVKWTTGTTGAPKGAEYSEERLLRHIVGLASGELFSSNDIWLGDCAICYLTMVYLWLAALHRGCTIVVSKTCHAVPLDVFDVIKDCEAVTIITISSRIRRILDFMKTTKDWDKVLRRTLRRIVLVASTPPPGLAEELINTFQLAELRNIYGMTEAGGCMTLPPKGELSCENVGFPIAGARMKIIDTESNKVLGPMQCGEVLFDTPCAAIRYCGHDEAEATITDEQGWIHTGDLGYYDHDGRLFLCGRLKTMMVCQRRKVSPVNIEHCLIEHPAVEEAAVVGVSAPDGDQFPAAVVVAKRGHNRDQQLADELKRHVAERNNSSMHLHGGVYFIDALPKNTLGKARSALILELVGMLRRMDSADETVCGDLIY